MKEFPREFLKSVFLSAIENDPSPKEVHITRLAMYKDLREKIILPSRIEGVISISGSIPLCDWLHLPRDLVTQADFPRIDCTDLPYESNSFDVYISDQVLEHVEGNPFKVFAEANRVLRPGGIGIITTCFINPVHGHPSDFWRFTENALILMANEAGLSVLFSGAWGNRFVWPFINLGLRMEKLPSDENHPLHKLALLNEPDVPISTWVVFQKANF